MSGEVAGGARRTAFGGLLVVAMAVATFTAVSIGLLATFLIDDFDVSRAQLGMLIAVNTVLAAFLSPIAGRATDALGGKRAFAGLFAVSALAFLLLAGAPWFAAMFLGAAMAAVAQASANPATNKLIALHMEPGRRGVVTGIKQSGVQFGVFFGGLLVPSAAIALGWRTTLALVALIPLLALPIALWVVPADPSRRERLHDLPAAPSGAIRWLSVYGFLLGLAGAVTFLVPLFVEEALGLSTRVAGLAAGLIGFTAIFGRIGWARFAERRGSFAGPLAAIAGIGVIGWLAFFGAAHLATWLLWVGVVLTGLGNSSWNSVGMLAVMSESGAARAGPASGVVMLGFLTGLGLGPPIYGWTVDQTGAYDAMWLLASALSVAGFIMASWRARRAFVSGVAGAPPTI